MRKLSHVFFQNPRINPEGKGAAGEADDVCHGEGEETGANAGAKETTVRKLNQYFMEHHFFAAGAKANRCSLLGVPTTLGGYPQPRAVSHNPTK